MNRLDMSDITNTVVLFILKCIDYMKIQILRCLSNIVY